MSQSGDSPRKKSVSEELDEMALKDDLDHFYAIVKLADQEITRPPLPAEVENAIRVPRAKLEDSYQGSLRAAADLVEDLGISNVDNMNLNSANSALMTGQVNANDIGIDLAFNYMNNERALKKELKQVGRKDYTAALSKALPYIVLLIIVLTAIVEIFNPKLLLPLSQWLQPSPEGTLNPTTGQYVGGCSSTVATSNPGANQSYIQLLTQKCASSLAILGYEHVAIFIIGIASAGGMLFLVWRSRRKRIQI